MLGVSDIEHVAGCKFCFSAIKRQRTGQAMQ